MIKAECLTYGFPEKDLYQKISFELTAGCHCVLIGSNGCGKTTLVQLIRDPEQFLFQGKLIRENVGRIGYVSQFSRRSKSDCGTVFDYLMEDFKKLNDAVSDVCNLMESEEDLDDLLEHYQTLLDEQSAVDAANCEANIYRQLHLAGLENKDGLSLTVLSGGEYKLIQVIRQMLRRPGLLIMDEPDVFLDFENLNGLRDLINDYKGTLLVITHNRYLLNHCFDRVWHLENEDLQEFDGTFPEYQLALLNEKLCRQESFNQESAEIQRAEVMVERLRKEATEVIDPVKGRMLKGKVSYLERWKSKQIKPPFVESRHPVIRMPFAPAQNKETVLLQVNNYSLIYDSPLLEDVSFTIHAGEKVAIVGPNGTGKTSLLRDIQGGSNPAVQLGCEAVVGTFSQILDESLCETQSILDEFLQAGMETRREVENYLSAYCFQPDGLRRKINQLSGGEKNLLQLAKLALGEKNLLLLDEPSSHLDTFAQVALEQAISNYPGAVLMVSHDFYTITNCMDRVLVAEDHTLRPVSMRAFRKRVYRDHFSLNELSLETQKKALEEKIRHFMQLGDTDGARALLDELAEVTEARK